MHAPALRLAELVGVRGEVGRQLLLARRRRREDGWKLDERPRRANRLVAERVRLLDLGRRHLHAVPDRALHLGARQLAPHLGLEARGARAAPSQELLIAPKDEAAALLEGRHRVDLRVQLLVRDEEPLAPRALDDQRLLDEIVDDLLREAEPLGELRREAVAVHLRVGVHVRLVAALEAVEGNGLAVDRGDLVARGALAAHAPGAEDEQRADEGRDHQEQADLQGLSVPAHHGEHRRPTRRGRADARRAGARPPPAPRAARS